MKTVLSNSTVPVWRVIIIEDSPEDRGEIRRLLLQGSDRRYQFVEAETGAAGVRAILDPSNGPPDCVVLDYTLRNTDGYGVVSGCHRFGRVDCLPSSGGDRHCRPAVRPGGFAFGSARLYRQGLDDGRESYPRSGERYRTVGHGSGDPSPQVSP